MIPIVDLVRTLHDIDAAKGRTCGACFYRTRKGYGGHCRLGMRSGDLDDGCESFRGRPVDAFKAWPVSRQAETGKAARRPSNEPGGAI